MEGMIGELRLVTEVAIVLVAMGFITPTQNKK
jgi:hypothetical protein